jgi:RNA polymerase sigma-70 factor (ECF subfamily)
MRADSRKEFEAFFRQHHELALRIAHSILGNPDLANDAAQEAFVKVLDRWPHVREMESSGRFLRQIIVRCAIDILRNRRREVQHDEDRCNPSHHETIAVKHALAKLKPDQQVILALAIGEGWSYAEIAEALNIPPGTVASRIHAAKEAFRRQWGNEP